VVGPKDLPKVLRSITTFIRKIKTMASQFHSGIDDLANESEISDLRKEVSKIENNPILDSEINEIKDFKNEINVKSLKDNVNEIKNSQNTLVKPKKTSKTIKK
jgi:sec-independent protein translocase protein TatB